MELMNASIRTSNIQLFMESLFSKDSHNKVVLMALWINTDAASIIYQH